MNIRSKFRKRWLGRMGYAGGAPEMANVPILLTPKDKAENSQTQQKSVRNKNYTMGTSTPRRKRTLHGKMH